MATRGGYGLTRLLDAIDWSLLARSVEQGTRWVGHSDLTALQLGLGHKGRCTIALEAQGRAADENERATRGELDITAVSIHAYAYVSDKYALLPSGASMGDGYGPMLVAKQKFSRDEIARKKIAVPGTMTSA